MGPHVCVMWATLDVLMCTASIWHMCTMSMDRFFTLKYPMKYGRNKTKTTVALKIAFVWIMSISISSPLGIMGLMDHSNVYNNGVCVPTITNFVIFGSLCAFYLPFTIMIVTYVMTIKILCDNQKVMKSIANQHSDKMKKEQNNGAPNPGFLSPNMYTKKPHRKRTSVDSNISMAPTINESVNPSALPSPTKENKDLHVPNDPQDPQPSQDIPDNLTNGGKTEESISDRQCGLNLSVSNRELDKVSIQSSASNKTGSLPLDMNKHNKATYSTSMPLFLHQKPHPLGSGTLSQYSLPFPKNQLRSDLHYVTRASSASHLSMRSYNMEDLIPSQCSSINSMLSQAHSSAWGSAAVSDFEDPDLMEKLSQIEQEMDECLMEGPVVHTSCQDIEPENQSDDSMENDKVNVSGAASVQSLCHDKLHDQMQENLPDELHDQLQERVHDKLHDQLHEQ